MRVVCKPNIKQRLDELIISASINGDEIDYIEMTTEEYNRLCKRIEGINQCWIDTNNTKPYKGYPIKIKDIPKAPAGC